ncbi:MAG: ATPase, T2SS/T4P/T4SS family [Actinomycetaceae bacterium]|nr:ATPase, T2SS/T4P/T4SS family [Actinomycetaceae bacterium]
MSSITISQRQALVRKEVAEAGIDPVVDTASLGRIIEQSFLAYPAESAEQRRYQTTALRADIGGYGQLQKLLDHPQVEEVYLNSPSSVFVAKSGRSELTTVILTTEEVRDLVERMLHHSGRRLDLSVPFVDAMLPGGERLHVVIPPVAGKHWSVNIRKHVASYRDLGQLVEIKMLTAQMATFLKRAVAAGLTIVVSGATQAGKTTLVRALAGAIPMRERVITCEEVFELNLTNRDCVAMQTRNPNIEGAGAVSLRDLVRESLRMRPERIIVGEVRGAEALDMLLSLNAGIPGLSTVHANAASEALMKLSLLPLLAGENVSSQFVVPTVANSIDLVVHVTRQPDGSRHVSEIVAVTGIEAGNIITQALWNGHTDTAITPWWNQVKNLTEEPENLRERRLWRAANNTTLDWEEEGELPC